MMRGLTFVFLVVVCAVFMPGGLQATEPVPDIQHLAIQALPISEDVLSKPADIAVLGQTVVVVDEGNNCVFSMDRQGSVQEVIGHAGNRPGQFLSPQAIALSGDGGIYVADVGNRRLTRTEISDHATTVIDHDFYIFDVAACSKGVAYTGTRKASAGLVVFVDSSGISSSIGEQWWIEHEYESVSRNANTVKLDVAGGLLAVGSPALAKVRIYSLAGDLKHELFIESPDVARIREQAWSSMLTGVDPETRKARLAITTPVAVDIENDFVALARPHRFGFPSYIADLKLADDQLLVLVGGVMHVYSLKGRLKARYEFIDDEGEQVFLFAFAIDSEGVLWGTDRVHTRMVYRTEVGDWLHACKEGRQ